MMANAGEEYIPIQITETGNQFPHSQPSNTTPPPPALRTGFSCFRSNPKALGQNQNDSEGTHSTNRRHRKRRKSSRYPPSSCPIRSLSNHQQQFLCG
ncbi:hypothetical protein Pst134EA_032012 [Puccinia striiformis f. sp. tritici]|uniref:uncharacterized protein n=1 Tax=Puccinia striiformis f. sp. tritici TaxID=168172 RepID=UPI0020089917|nr:uncharacterized protein Pst134EA_032012 [Puccinia striiformis f. sp. tritici]KAH9444375.1 hypothetical protein Pst134EA_032012 [Puccinia striiformis f. sp. tritici]